MMFTGSPNILVCTPGTPIASIPPIEILNSFVPSDIELFTISIVPTFTIVTDGVNSKGLLIVTSFVSE